MVANNIPAPAIVPIGNPFLEGNYAERLDQLFQMCIQRGAQPDEADNIYLYGYYDTQQQEIVVQLGRGEDAQYGVASEQMTLGEFIREAVPQLDGAVEQQLRFTEAVWCGWGDKEDAPAFILNDTASILAFHFVDLHREGLAVSLDAVIIQPVVQA
jgi:hypothetical protein